MIINTLGHRLRPSLQTGLTATGSSQATAFLLTNNTLHEFTTVASSTGAILPVGVTPSEVSIFNHGASSLSIYPPTGGSIDAGTANASVSLAAGSGVTFWASTPSNWYHLVTSGVGGGTPGGTAGQIQFDNAGAFGGFTASGDATINTSTGAVTVTKTGGVGFAPSATTDTTNASNITSGTLASARLPAISASSITTGTLPAAQLPATGVSAASITTGTLAVARLPALGASGTSHAAGIAPDPGATAGTTHFLREDATWAVPASGGSGTVTSVSVASANGFAGTVATATTTPAITLTTTASGLLKGSSGAIAAATAGTDYVVPTVTTLPDLSLPASQVTGLAPSATTDTTNASNITTGTLSAAQLPALSGAVVSAGGTGVTTFGTIPTLEVVSNITGSTAAAAPNTLTSIFDAVFGATVNGIVTRGASVWQLVSNLILPSTGPARFTTGPFINVVGPGTAVANTTTQSSLFTGATFRSGQSLTLPANSLIAGDEIEIALWGTMSISATVSFTITVLLGSTVVMEAIANSLTGSVTGGEWYLGVTPTKLWFPQVGASGTCGGRGSLQAAISPSTNSFSTIPLYNGAALGLGTLTSINTTNALALDIQVKWSVASASNSIQLIAGTIKKSG
jgi:hypothetical protein